MKIISVTIENIHDVESKTYEFGQLQYITGPNASGKSTILQSIQLALLGYIPGTGKKVSDVFKHCKSGKKSMAVTLKLDDEGQEVVIERNWAAAKTSVVSNITVTPESYDIASIVEKLELPIFNFEELLQLTANKLKDYFTDLLASNTDDSINWHDRIIEFSDDIDKVDPSYADQIIAQVKEIGLSGIEEVKAMNAKLKAELSAEKSSQLRNEQTIQNLIYYKDFVPAYSSEFEYQQEINNCHDMIRLQDAYKSACNQRDSIKTELDAYVEPPKAPEYDDFKDYPEFKALEVQIADFTDKIASAREQESHISSEIAELTGSKRTYMSVINGKGICPFTQKSCESMLPLVNEYTDTVAKIDSDIKNLTAQKATLNNQISEWRRKQAELENDEREFSYEYANSKTIYYRYLSLQNQMLSIKIPAVDESILTTDWSERIKDVTEDYGKFKANEEYNSLISKLNVEKSKIAIKIQFLKDWIDLTSVNKMQAELSNNAFLLFANIVNDVSSKLFSDGSQFTFYLENKANTFTFGLKRNGSFIPYDLISSGEKCMLMLSLLTCVVQKIDSPLKVIMIDDMLDHLDDVNIVNLVEVAASETDVQYIFAGVKSLDAKLDSNDIKILKP